MPLPRVYKVVQDSLGNVVPLVSCSVLLEGTGTLATLWQDDAGTIPLSNPMISDATYGSFAFYVTPAHYDLTFTKPGYTFQSILDLQVPQDDLTLGTMAQQDASAVTITGGAITGVTVSGMPSLGVTGPSTLGGNVDCMGTMGVRRVHNDAISLYVDFLKVPMNGIVVHGADNDAGSGASILFTNVAGAGVGTITTTGSATAYNTTSDSRLKSNVQPLTGALAVVQALRPVAFRWRSNDAPGHGFLASEVAQVVDGVITGEADAVDEEGRIVPQMIDMSKLVPWLTAALQDTLAQVQGLAARVASLEEQLGV